MVVGGVRTETVWPDVQLLVAVTYHWSSPQLAQPADLALQRSTSSLYPHQGAALGATVPLIVASITVGVIILITLPLSVIIHIKGTAWYPK